MTEDTPPREPRLDLINEVQARWGEISIQAHFTPEELMNCAGHFLANVLVSIAIDEASAHELMNRVTETNHMYINATWPEMKAKRDLYGVKRKAAEGGL